MILEIPAAPPGLNVLLRMNWYRRHAEGKKWQKLIWVARCQAVVGKPDPILRARVILTRTSPKRLDQDNLYGSAKLVLDALKHLELIVDDNPEALELVVRQEIGKAKLRIELSALPIPVLCPSLQHLASTSSVAAN